MFASHSHSIARPVALVIALVFGAAARADVVTTVDGARLTGKILKITPKAVDLDTSYAGKLTVAMDKVATFSTDAELTTQFTDTTTVTGTTALDEQKTIRVAGASTTSSGVLDRLLAAWPAGSTPPPESAFDTRHWVYTLGADIAGKAGNSDEMTTNVLGSMALISKRDELRLYGSYQRAEQDGNDTSDEKIGGASYTNFFNDPWGWYTRGELEQDKFEDIDLRTTIAGGLTWRPVHTDDRTLRFWLGLGYRHESFDGNVEDDSSTTMDSGVAHHWQLKPWLILDNSIAYAPALDDFSNYLLTHDSAFVMPVGASKWTLRLGVHNDYNSEPAPDRDKLDTTYYSRLQLRFE